MFRATILTLFSLSFALLGEAPATAQQADPAAPESTVIIRTAPGQSAAREVWFQRDLEDAKTRVRRTRNALIGTSASFAVGLILAGSGASQCEYIDRINQNDELRCNRAGDVLLPLGGTIAALGAIGMITSGIMLGVAKKRKREIERDYRRSVYGRRLEWDPSGALRF